MTDRLTALLAEIWTLSLEERRRLEQALAEMPGKYQVRDGGTSNEFDRVKYVTVTLPDDLASEAQAAGLLGSKSLEHLIRQALRQRAAKPGESSGERRRIVRKNGRLVVEAFPGEEAITDAEVRDHLANMDW